MIPFNQLLNNKLVTFIYSCVLHIISDYLNKKPVLIALILALTLVIFGCTGTTTDTKTTDALLGQINDLRQQNSALEIKVNKLIEVAQVNCYDGGLGQYANCYVNCQRTNINNPTYDCDSFCNEEASGDLIRQNCIKRMGNLIDSN